MGERIRERGSATVLVAVVVALVALTAMLALDLWRAVLARDRAQAAADAAALAAAGAIAAGAGPSEAAAEYARANGATLEGCACDPSAGEAVVTVRVEFSVAMLGGTVRSVVARARAIVDGWSELGTRMRGLQPWFVARLLCLTTRVPGISIVSGFRTRAEQARLFREKPGLAAPPGRSLHEVGLAADLAYATPGVSRRAHAAAGGCGLVFGVPGEPWHVAPAGWE